MILTKLFFSLIALMFPFVKKKLGYFIYEAFSLRNETIVIGTVN